MNKEEIYNAIEKLEQERIQYLEVNNKAGARRKEKEIYILRNSLEIADYEEIKRQLKLYKKFIIEKGMKLEFENFLRKSQSDL